MNNFGSASLGFLVGVVVAFSAAKLTESAVVQEARLAERDDRRARDTEPLFLFGLAPCGPGADLGSSISLC
jgi:hypothetical protein